jgi:hypothetical protein
MAFRMILVSALSLIPVCLANSPYMTPFVLTKGTLKSDSVQAKGGNVRVNVGGAIH